MKGGDLGIWDAPRVVVVLEGVLCVPFRRRRKLVPVDDWGWQRESIKYLNDTAHRHSIPVDVVTFISQEVADLAADWFDKYHVEVSTTTYVDFGMFCQSLQWTTEIDRVIDSDPHRLQKYGQRGYATTNGGTF